MTDSVDWPEGYGPDPVHPSQPRPFAPIEVYVGDEDVRQSSDLLPVVDISAWKGDPPPRRSLWGNMLPLLQTTMLTGIGGIGKSLFEQVLLTHIALGRRFLGMEVNQRNVLYVTCEDDEAELWRRQDAICAAIGVPIEALQGKMFLCSLTGEQNTALATFNEHGLIQPTERWRQLERTCEAFEVGIYAFDNATDAMAGDLNDIHQVAEFVGMLTGLAMRRDGVAMIIHHPNKAGEDWLGSVAWHNKVRSRLIIEKGEEEDDADARVIRNPKANYGPQGGRISFRWHRGTFVRDEDLPSNWVASLTDTVKATAENAAFMACLRARAAQGDGRAVGSSPGPNYAPAQFEGMAQAKGYRKATLKRAMDRLFGIGRIEAVQVHNKKSGRCAFIIREVPEGSHNSAHNGSTSLSHNSAHPPAQRGTTHTIDTTYQYGAPLVAGEPDVGEPC